MIFTIVFSLCYSSVASVNNEKGIAVYEETFENKASENKSVYSNNADLFIDDNSISTTVQQEVYYNIEGNCRVEFRVNSKGPTEYVGEISLTNIGEKSLENWILQFDLKHDISNMWNAEIISHEGNSYIIKNMGWNQDIVPGSSVTIGFVAEGSQNISVPDNFDLIMAKQQVSNADCSIQFEIISDWGKSFNGNIKITNTSKETIEDWILEFEFDRNIESFWTAEIVERNDDKYVIRNRGYNANIVPGQTLVLGFTGNPGDVKSEPSGYTLSQINQQIDYSKDSDGDSLPDVLERELKSNPYKIDSDNDGLPDGYEYFILKTDLIKQDTDADGVLDADEDFDNDGLDNLKEYTLGTDPYSRDTDYDGIDDGKEIDVNGTDPTLFDTDDDGLSDGDELLLGTDPNKPDTDGDGIIDSEEVFLQTVSKDIYMDQKPELISVNVSFASSGNINRTTTIESTYGVDMKSTNVVGLVGSPISIETESEFEKATISFNYDDTVLGAIYEENLGILWYNEKENVYTLLQSELDTTNNIISVETTHFSTYMVVDKQQWFEIWDRELNYTSHYNEKRSYNTVLAIDCSGSMATYDPFFTQYYSVEVYPGHYETASRRVCNRILASEGYINTLHSDDKAAVLAFDEYTKWLCDLTNDKSTLKKSLSGIYSSGGTNFDNALKTSISKLKSSTGSTHNMIILLSDGESSVSNSVLQQAKDAYIKIYTIGLGPNSLDSKLKYIATYTDGEFFKAATAEELIELYSKIGIEKDFDLTDTDNDGLADIFETAGMKLENGQIVYTNPLDPDTDGDGLLDGAEISPAYKYMPGNGIPGEVLYKTRGIYFVSSSDPNQPDSDWDKIPDDKDSNPYVYDKLPEKFIEYIKEGAVDMATIRKADDGFTICLTPLSDLFSYYDIDSLPDYSGDLSTLFDDWYVYAIKDSEKYTYSIIKLRYYNGNDDPGVAIPFKEFNINLIDDDESLWAELSEQLVELTQMGEGVVHDESVRKYFANSNNKTNYFIADVYIDIIIKKECTNGTISAKTYLDRQKKELLKNPQIYNESKEILRFENINNLSLKEKQCILLVRSGNPSYNSFAAEIIYHAVKTQEYFGTRNFWFGLDKGYNAAKKADMGVNEENDDWTDDTYINYNGKYVKEQRNLFGDK